MIYRRLSLSVSLLSLSEEDDCLLSLNLNRPRRHFAPKEYESTNFHLKDLGGSGTETQKVPRNLSISFVTRKCEKGGVISVSGRKE